MVADSDDLPPLTLDRPRIHKLLNNIKTLDPTNKLAIKDWLIALKAATSWPFAKCFAPRVLRADFRNACGFVGEHYDKYSVDDYDALFDQYENRELELETALFGFIVGHCEWQKEPELALKIRGTADKPGWEATQDGRALLDWLTQHGSYDDHNVQQLLLADWANIFFESQRTAANAPRTIIVFDQTASAEDVCDRLAFLLENYEKVASNRASPPSQFISALTTLISEDVEQMKQWGHNEKIDIARGKSTMPSATRLEWVTEMNKLLRATLPARSLSYTPAHR
jgi:hypothetical protein